MDRQEHSSRRHRMQLATVDQEIARLALVCGIRVFDSVVIERVICDDATVCGRSSRTAFRQLRAMMVLHYVLTNESVRVLGAAESARILDEIRQDVRRRFELGGSGKAAGL